MHRYHNIVCVYTRHAARTLIRPSSKIKCAYAVTGKAGATDLVRGKCVG